MKEKILIYVAALLIILAVSLTEAHARSSDAKKPPERSKFYDFSEQLIDGEIKKPANLYVDSKERVRFDRLLKLKKSFMPMLFDTAKQKVFK